MATALSPVVLWAVILAAGVGTYFLRLSFIPLFGRFEQVPPRVERVLRLVPAAVLAALVFPAIFAPDGQVALSIDNARLLAGAIAGVVAWRTENMVATIVVGMGTLWALGAVLP